MCGPLRRPSGSSVGMDIGAIAVGLEPFTKAQLLEVPQLTRTAQIQQPKLSVVAEHGPAERQEIDDQVERDVRNHDIAVAGVSQGPLRLVDDDAEGQLLGYGSNREDVSWLRQLPDDDQHADGEFAHEIGGVAIGPTLGDEAHEVGVERTHTLFAPELFAAADVEQRLVAQAAHGGP